MVARAARVSRMAAVLASLLGSVTCLGAGTSQQPDAAVQDISGYERALAQRREAMVTDQIAGRGIADPAVLAAMRKVPRHLFVPLDLAHDAYADSPLPIGHGQTISQPYIVAYMSEALKVARDHKVLEIGTGSGYQAAVLGELAHEVFTVEIVPELGEHARALLARLGHANVHVRVGDGYAGWPEHAPFDRVMVTAAPDHVPQPLVDQLKVGGILVLPVGTWSQEMVVITKTHTGILERRTIPVRFVPLTRGPAGE